MVRGLDLFRQYFRDHQDKYILIGGTACDIAMRQMGREFRGTKDLDIVLIVEVLDSEFCRLLWTFVKEGEYEHKQKSTGKTEFYRFYQPTKDEYPYMLELFSRKPDSIVLPPESYLTPIPLDEEVSSLSAILMNEDYYGFVLSGKVIAEDLPVIPEIYLIPLKAKAYLDLLQRRESGNPVDKDKIKKHKNDVFRLYQILNPEMRIELPKSIEIDLRVFQEKVKEDPPDLKNLKIQSTSLDEIFNNLSKIYNLTT
jgi:hypothetical protein